jgi:hypothetical protein
MVYIIRRYQKGVDFFSGKILARGYLLWYRFAGR